MDKMEFFEIRALMKYSYYANKEDWEQARLVAYIIAQCNSTKNLKMQDILSFHWEDNKSEDTTITAKDIDRLQEKSKQFAALLNK